MTVRHFSMRTMTPTTFKSRGLRAPRWKDALLPGALP